MKIDQEQDRMNLESLIRLFEGAGARELYAKPLAENDNSINQIYLATDTGFLNALPCRKFFDAKNTKRGPSFKADLNFEWLQKNGSTAQAPHAKLILYAQYPEVRFSGFLSGCNAGPNELMMERERARKADPSLIRRLKGRLLFLGVTDTKKIIGYVASGTSQITSEFRNLKYPNAFGAFNNIPLQNSITEDQSRKELLKELRRISQKGWIDSKQLSESEGLEECNARNCGGYTLEAELGIPKNSEAKPDFLGWEVKQHTVSKTTIFTCEPDGGLFKELGTKSFLFKYGYPDKNGVMDRINFGGYYKLNKPAKATNMTMKLDGFNHDEKKIENAKGTLFLEGEQGEIISSWSFSKLLEHLNNKHRKAAYVPAECRMEPSRQYRYSNKVKLCYNNKLELFLGEIINGRLTLEPGIKIENAYSNPKPKQRHQFRINPNYIESLYTGHEVVTV